VILLTRSVRPLVVLALGGALAASPLVLAASGAVRQAPPVVQAWTPPLSLAGGGAEPSIRTSPDGRAAAYVSAPSGLGANFWRVDQVKNPDGTYRMTAGKAMQPDLGTGGGDAEISVGTTIDPATGCAPIAYSR
jgi:hypothetical protein